jgi:hypothetical protein
MELRCGGGAHRADVVVLRVVVVEFERRVELVGIVGFFVVILVRLEFVERLEFVVVQRQQLEQLLFVRLQLLQFVQLVEFFQLVVGRRRILQFLILGRGRRRRIVQLVLVFIREPAGAALALSPVLDS